MWNYNIYIKPNATAEPIQVTNDGKVNQILNGIPDWCYEGQQSIHLSIHLSLFICPSPSISLPIQSCMFTSIHPVISTSVYPAMNPSIPVCMHFSIHCPSTYLYMHLSIHLRIQPTAHPSIPECIRISISIHPFISLFHSFSH